MRPGTALRVALWGFLAGWWCCARVALLVAADAAIAEAERISKAAADEAS